MGSSKKTVLYNGNFITADEGFSLAQAVAIRDGRFEATGGNEELKNASTPDTELIDLQGKTVVPGFVDSHNHMLWTALEKPKVSLVGTQSVADVLDIIRDACKAAGPGNWVETSQMGFEPRQLKENRSPNLKELDSVSPNNPVIHEEHFHNSLVNSYVLNMMGITKDTPNPPGGLIIKDIENGRPTGWLGDNAVENVKVLIPRLSWEEKVTLLKSVMSDFNSLGITTVIDPWLTLEEMELYRELWAEKKLTIRTRTLLSAPPLKGGLSSELIKEGPIAISQRLGLGDHGDDMLRIDGLKTMLDSGVLGTYFREPYEVIPGEQNDPTWRGWLSMSSDDLRKLSRLVAESGWRMSVHCCGDAAMDILLDVWTDVNRAISILDKHWVLLHGQVPRPEHFTKIKALDLRVACQSVHTYTMGADFVKWWGLERARYSDPIKTYLNNEIRVGGGSDAYFCEWNPLIQIWFDVTRQSKWAGVLGPDQAITREQSITYHTTDSALISDDHDKLGSIKPGNLADFVVLSDDILNCPVDQIRDIRVLMTVMNGDLVYQDNQYDLHISRT